MQTAAELGEGICKYYNKFKQEKHREKRERCERSLQGSDRATARLVTVSVLEGTLNYFLLNFKAERLPSGLGWNDCDLVTHSHF